MDRQLKAVRLSWRKELFLVTWAVNGDRSLRRARDMSKSSVRNQCRCGQMMTGDTMRFFAMSLHHITTIFPRAKDVCFIMLSVCTFFKGRQRALFVKNNLNDVQLVLLQCHQLKTTKDTKKKKKKKEKQFYEDCSWKYWASSFHVFL